MCKRLPAQTFACCHSHSHSHLQSHFPPDSCCSQSESESETARAFCVVMQLEELVNHLPVLAPANTTILRSHPHVGSVFRWHGLLERQEDKGESMCLLRGGRVRGRKSCRAHILHAHCCMCVCMYLHIHMYCIYMCMYMCLHKNNTHTHLLDN